MMGLKTTQFLALTLTTLALVPAGAHLLALPNKIDLSEADYFTVQGIYRGWALLGIVLCAAILADLALSVRLRRQRAAFWCALVAFLAMCATLTIFFAWIFPANKLTVNWTVVPEDWRTLRAQWEYSHAVNAALTFLAFCAVALSTLLARDDAG
jgi:hypothetical protein